MDTFPDLYAAHEAPKCPLGSFHCRMARTMRTLWPLRATRAFGHVFTRSLLSHLSVETKAPELGQHFHELFRVKRCSVRDSKEAAEACPKSDTFDPEECVCRIL